MFYYFISCLWMVNAVAGIFDIIEENEPLSLLNVRVSVNSGTHMVEILLQFLVDLLRSSMLWIWDALGLTYGRCVRSCSRT